MMQNSFRRLLTICGRAVPRRLYSDEVHIGNLESGVNSVTLLGRIGNDPETRVLANNASVLQFRLATSEIYEHQGKLQKATQWHSISCFEQRIIDNHFFQKGDLAYVHGKITYSKETNQAHIRAARIMMLRRAGNRAVKDTKDEGDIDEEQDDQEETKST